MSWSVETRSVEECGLWGAKKRGHPSYTVPWWDSLVRNVPPFFGFDPLARSPGATRCKGGCVLLLALLALATLVGVYVFRAQLLTAAGNFLVEDDGPRKADAIVVLGGDRYGNRTLKGGELAKAGYAPVVYVSGPPRLMGYESSDEVAYVEGNGYPAAMFQEARLPGEAESTRTEAQFLGKYLAARGIKSILLVTSNFHTKRAAKLWRQENPTLPMTVVASSDPYFTPNGWWKTREGKKTFAYEWAKTISVMFGI